MFQRIMLATQFRQILRMTKSCRIPAVLKCNNILSFERQLTSGRDGSGRTKSRIELRVLQESHRAGAIELLTDVFYRHGPVLKYLGASCECVKHLNEIAVNQTIRDGVGTVAIDTEVNKVAGVLTSILKSHEKDGSEDYDLKLIRQVKPYLDVIAILRARFYQLDEVKAEQSRGNRMMETYQVGVGDDYHGRNLILRMIYHSFKLGKLKGVKFAYSEVTNPIVQHVLSKDPGFVFIGDMIKYANFETDGWKPLAGMPADCKGAVVFKYKL
ncbi:uncharacterized protein [Ptychodera flava]|uniref:uncharacterized protein isoform X1 n=1 Tax=Ptychodera flava TaxID=63121 RepID=UPI00396A4967